MARPHLTREYPLVLSHFQSIMRVDEKLALDTLRLGDMLLIIIFDGRGALPKAKIRSTTGEEADREGEIGHRAVVEAIRAKDTGVVRVYALSRLG